MVEVIGRAKVIVVGEVDRNAVTQTGSQMGTFLGGALRKTAVAAGVGIGALVGGAIAKGFSRLSAIEEAEAKLKGLGNSAKTVTTVMENALASVQGTAFGLGDAASIAAGAIASGVKPGQELERTLKLVADAATIGGTSLEEMGAIFNKVSATGKAQGEVLNQLGERGIPILQLLSKSLGVNVEEVLKLSEQGKISFADFQKAIEEGMGGAALKSGETFKGALANAGAALGRFGAALLGPSFKDAPSVFAAITEELDDLTPAAEKAGKQIQIFLDSFRTPEPIGTGTVLSEEALGLGPLQEALEVQAEEAGRSWWQKFLASFKENTETEVKGLGEFLAKAFGEQEFSASDIPWVGHFWDAGIDNEGLDKALKDMVTSIEDFGDELKEAWDKDAKNVRDGVRDIVNNIRAFPKEATDQVNEWREAGHDLIQGFWDGVTSKVSGKVGDIVQGLKDALNSSLGLPRTINIPLGPDVRIPAFAGGVQNFGGGLALVGERGPELVGLPAGSNVYSNQESNRMLGSAGGGGFELTQIFNGPTSLAEARREADWARTYGTRFGSATAAGAL